MLKEEPIPRTAYGRRTSRPKALSDSGSRRGATFETSPIRRTSSPIPFLISYLHLSCESPLLAEPSLCSVPLRKYEFRLSVHHKREVTTARQLTFHASLPTMKRKRIVYPFGPPSPSEPGACRSGGNRAGISDLAGRGSSSSSRFLWW